MYIYMPLILAVTALSNDDTHQWFIHLSCFIEFFLLIVQKGRNM